jgi:hypothetical protein
MKHVLTCLLLLCSFGAAAQSTQAPKSPSDCEKIKNDLAYNQCLASFGPKQGERATRGPHGDNDEPAARPRRGGRFVQRSRVGRQSAAFEVVSGRRASRSRR